MKKPMYIFKKTAIISCAILVLGSCSLTKKKQKGFAMQTQESTTVHKKGSVSQITGVPYNDDTYVNSFVVKAYEGQPDGPNLVFIQGGRFVMGTGEEDILYTHDNVERTVSIQSFFMDRTETANIHWLEFMSYFENPENHDLIPEGMTFEDYRDQILLPDTTVWASETAFNDSYVSNYLRYPGFRMYPVVGVSWVQAKEYCRWRTTAANEWLAKQAVDAGKIESMPPRGESLPLEEGVTLPDYRLPTEAEWEYAAKGLIGTQYNDENQVIGRIYPWDGHALRASSSKGKKMGQFLANFKRGRGDYAGIAGKQNDGALITAPVNQFYPPNDYGLYHMAGNVSEWVEDVYRPLSFQYFDDLNPVTRQKLDSTKIKSDITKSVYRDNSELYNDAFARSLVTDSARVYKGGSWKDVAFWLAPGTRRYLNMHESSATIGFRCAMIMAGEANGENPRSK